MLNNTIINVRNFHYRNFNKNKLQPPGRAVKQSVRKKIIKNMQISIYFVYIVLSVF